MWQKNGVLCCDTCTAFIDWWGIPHVLIMERARAIGWHCYEGPSVYGDNYITSHICPDCMGTNRSKLPPATKPLAEDQPLFELEEKPDVRGGAENQEGQRPRRGRRPIRTVPPL